MTAVVDGDEPLVFRSTEVSSRIVAYVNLFEQMNRIFPKIRDRRHPILKHTHTATFASCRIGYPLHRHSDEFGERATPWQKNIEHGLARRAFFAIRTAVLLYGDENIAAHARHSKARCCGLSAMNAHSKDLGEAFAGPVDGNGARERSIGKHMCAQPNDFESIGSTAVGEVSLLLYEWPRAMANNLAAVEYGVIEYRRTCTRQSALRKRACLVVEYREYQLDDFWFQ